MIFTVKRPVEATLKVRRSVFTAYLAPSSDEGGARAVIAERSRLHSRATHNCWAYVLGFKGETEHFSDAGEPSGSAGRPMLNVLKSSRLSNVVVVVTRYFGGVKLGIRGLIEAYGDAVSQAVAAAEIVGLVETRRLRLSLPYELAERVAGRLEALGAVRLSSDYGVAVEMVFEYASALQAEVESFLGGVEADERVEVEFTLD